MVSQGSAVLVLFSSHGCLLLGVATPVFTLGVGLEVLVPLARMSFFFIYLYKDFLNTLYRFVCLSIIYKLDESMFR